MVEAAQEYDWMGQIGLQCRTRLRARSVQRFVRDGGFGNAYGAEPNSCRGRTSVGNVQEASVAGGVE